MIIANIMPRIELCDKTDGKYNVTLIEFIKNHVLINHYDRTNCNALVMIAVQKWNGLRRIKQNSRNQKFARKTFFLAKSLVRFTRQLNLSNHTYSRSWENFLEFCIISACNCNEFAIFGVVTQWWCTYWERIILVSNVMTSKSNKIWITAIGESNFAAPIRHMRPCEAWSTYIFAHNTCASAKCVCECVFHAPLHTSHIHSFFMRARSSQ